MKPSRVLLKRLKFVGIVVLTAAAIITLGLMTLFVLRDSNSSQVPAILASQSSKPIPEFTANPSLALLTPAPLPTPSTRVATPKSLPPLPASKLSTPKPQSIAKNTLGSDAHFDLPPANHSQNTQVAAISRYGHFPYSEDDPQRLESVGQYYDRTEVLDYEAANAFKKMQADSSISGIKLSPISGFRTIADQEKLFSRQIQRQGSKEAAARLSAPAGYSEHHTGYAIDIGDGNRPELDLKFDFEYTDAYHWLKVNARTYGFELSFPLNNAQGVSFEPWHWRYVGSSRAVSLFTLARRV